MYHFGYTEVPLSRKVYTEDTKAYLKAILKFVPEDQQEEFKKQSVQFLKDIRKKFKEITCYSTPSSKENGTIPISYWKEGAEYTGPTFLYFKHGLKKSKF